MTSETKVGLLFGTVMILIVGIAITELLQESREAPQMTGVADQTQNSVYEGSSNLTHAGRDGMNGALPTTDRQEPVQLPGEMAYPYTRERIITEPSHRDRQLPSAVAVDRSAPSLDDIINRIPQQDRRVAAASAQDNQSHTLRSNEYPVAEARATAEDHRLLQLQQAAHQMTREQARDSDYSRSQYALQGEEEINITPSRHISSEYPIAQADSRASAALDTQDVEDSRFKWHTVGRGETLYHIAKRYYGDGERWRDIRDANPQRVKADGNVRDGVRLKVPGLEAPAPAQARAERQPTQIQQEAPVNVIVESDLIIHDNSTAFRVVRSDESSRRGNTSDAGRVITVESNDTLSSLARKHLGNERRWPELVAANKDIIKDADDLQVGMKLRLPVGNQETAAAVQERPAASTPPSTPVRSAPAAERVYVVQEKDTLSKIAARELGDPNKWKLIFDANRDQLNSAGEIRVGQKLRIPQPAGPLVRQ